VQSLHLELAHAARAQPSTPSRERARATRDLLAALHDHLIAPLEQEIAGRDVLLAPHGHLWLVPFAAACLARGRPLESLAHVTSLEDLRLAREPHATRTHAAAVLGGTDQDLPSAREEVMLVRSELERAGMRVAEEPLHERPAIDLLHIAGHGIRRDDNPHFAAIRATDGFLSATDISELDLSQVQLVVLSGCETGRGSLETGRELGGLALAFLGAGARAVVSSLWPVADRETEQLMRVFYRQLGQGTPAARALAIAQADLERSLGDAGHPYFFGAFRIVGDGATALVSGAQAVTSTLNPL
jgi:CHAT domain-containing protein